MKTKSIQLIACLAWCIFSSSLQADDETVPPNLVFIIADDCTFSDIGCYGGQALTPNIDALAEQGMRMMQCFQAAPMCSPTRHSLYTGQYPVKTGAYPNHTFARDDVKSIVHYLQPLGYRVALSGKTHIGPESVFPFEYSKGGNAKKRQAKLDQAVVASEPSVINMGAIDNLMTECSETKKPFALFACSNEPHEPWNKGKRFRPQYDSAALKLRPYMVDTPSTRTAYRDYLAEISFFDSEVGQILSMIDQHDLADNTLVMVVSEQGNSFPFAKWSCYDAGLQSIMIVRWPGQVSAGSETDALVEYVDVCPTFVEAAGGTPAAIIDGKSLLPVLRGETDHHKDHVFGIQTTRGIFNGPRDYPIRSVRNERFKLIRNLDPDATFHNTINGKAWFRSWEASAEGGNEHAQSIIERFATRPAFELYDVQADPHELNNLAGDADYAAVLSELAETLAAWMQSQGDLGLETEMQAFEHMHGGNQEYKEWANAQKTPNQSKRGRKQK
ncbi:sulfatase family protein [Allorhodopirellula heiligendammensis]|uniref:Choline-sulfatase n=1 Tax=Allorhodopirellula heiligendammensis TaxID=2714739 RepID=A0A5C6BXQ8_9BACT|nr:sulfatase [Allorhodopirellula heiligendammensis]TWU16602.1 Choline-sulfatase [Allorhodopirellula heiligendammensis]